MSYKIYRIIDVNLNRAAEGVRVMEEVVRFILEDKRLTNQLKKIRGELCKVIRVAGYREGDIRKSGYQGMRARQAKRDVGREIYTKNEGKRLGIEDVFSANAKRAQEAVRCLEEFSKLLNPRYGKKFKKIRFELYELEKIVSALISRLSSLDFDLYVVTDPRRDHIEIARKAIAAGVKIIQLRDKKASKKQYLKWAQKIGKMARKAGVTFIVNDYLDIARKVDADGVHLGQEDLRKISIREARRRLGGGKIVGVSTHSYSQALRAARQGADYISLGPVFKTPSKPGASPVGLGLLRRVLKRVKIPVVAIGGINRSNIHKIQRAGCQRVAVIRAVLGKSKAFLSLLNRSTPSLAAQKPPEAL